MTVPGPITPYGAQNRFLEEVASGLAQGQHFFVTLKARQLGISTVMLALDIFWLYMFPGLQGALIADTNANLETFRQTITTMLESLPKGMRIGVKSHNRNALVLSNGSRLQYMSAGKGKNTSLGRSRALNFVHASEISSWGDQDGIDSLLAALAEENPNRLYIFESTALGYNVFFDMYRDALKDPKKRGFFIGWWAKEIYRIAEEDPEFQVWWSANPNLTEEEQAIFDLVKRDYGFEIQPIQWAWWRKIASKRSEASLLAEFPYHETVAFQVTGSAFFNLKRVNEDVEFIRGGGVTFDMFHYDLGDSFETMKCVQVPSADLGELRVYQKPVKHGQYVIGVDVAYGRSETADRHCISVWRCYADKIVQVAEYATSITETRTLAWVLAHLAGSYRNVTINLEVSGPGMQVMDEMRFCRQRIQTAHLRNLDPQFSATTALDQARWFLYHRSDVPGGGYLYNWKTNWDNKTAMLNAYRDAYNTGQVIARSAPLLDEMITLVQNGAAIQASGRNKDDRVFAAGLANYAWTTWVRQTMLAENRTWEIEQARDQQREEIAGDAVAQIIPQFFKLRQSERSNAQIMAFLSGNDYRGN